MAEKEIKPSEFPTQVRYFKFYMLTANCTRESFAEYVSESKQIRFAIMSNLFIHNNCDECFEGIIAYNTGKTVVQAILCMHSKAFEIIPVITWVRNQVERQTGNVFAKYDRQFAALFYLLELFQRGPDVMFAYTKQLTQEEVKTKVDMTQTTLEQYWKRAKEEICEIIHEALKDDDYD